MTPEADTPSRSCNPIHQSGGSSKLQEDHTDAHRGYTTPWFALDADSAFGPGVVPALRVDLPLFRSASTTPASSIEHSAFASIHSGQAICLPSCMHRRPAAAVTEPVRGLEAVQALERRGRGGVGRPGTRRRTGRCGPTARRAGGREMEPGNWTVRCPAPGVQL